MTWDNADAAEYERKIDDLRALLADATARAEKAEAATGVFRNDAIRYIGLLAEASDRAEKAEAERDLLFDALNLHMRKTGITNEAMERVEAFRAVVDANEPLVRGECTRLAKGWNDAADARKAAEAERDVALAACAEMRAALEEAERDIARKWTAESAERDPMVARIRAVLSRPDLGAGKVLVPRETLERVRFCLRRDSYDVSADGKRVVADLDALLDDRKGGG